jgi:N4-gp56 family major capsid protein
MYTCFAIAHEDLQADIENIDDFIPCHMYQRKDIIRAMEIGSINNIRILLSDHPDLVYSGHRNNDIYDILMILVNHDYVYDDKPILIDNLISVHCTLSS